jgi:deoxyribonuclease V
VDVHYPVEGGAWAAAVAGSDARFAAIEDEYICHRAEVAPYRPGAFFVRELPALRAVLRMAGRVGVVIVDGYVDLDPDGRPGLGAHLYDELGVPVIGVAKTMYRAATHAARVYRGSATRPLFVTAAGIAVPDAARLVGEMVGPYRLPDALRRVDSLARAGPAQDP